MSETCTLSEISTKPNLNSSRIILNAPLNSKEDDILNNKPEVVVDKALERLQRAGVVLIEWRALLYRRMNVPIIVKVSFSLLLCFIFHG